MISIFVSPARSAIGRELIPLLRTRNFIEGFLKWLELYEGDTSTRLSTRDYAAPIAATRSSAAATRLTVTIPAPKRSK